MAYQFVLLMVLLVGGCAHPGFEAALLGDSGVKQAILLSEQYGIKHCSHVDGSAGFWSITGNGESYTAMGKDVTMLDCFRFFNPGVTIPQ